MRVVSTSVIWVILGKDQCPTKFLAMRKRSISYRVSDSQLSGAFISVITCYDIGYPLSSVPVIVCHVQTLEHKQGKAFGTRRLLLLGSEKKAELYVLA